jgi:VCBS repeat-containing protein
MIWPRSLRITAAKGTGNLNYSALGETQPMNTLTFTIYGDVNIGITVTELENGDLKFDLMVLDDTGSIGDLNAVFFDITDDSIVSGLSVSGDDVTGSAFKVDGVTKVDNFTNMNGEVVKDYGKFDTGVQFGTQGISSDDIRETSFTLSHDSLDLTIDAVLGQDFGARLTSVGEEGGSREDSLKLGTVAPTDPDPVDEPEPVNTANDDFVTFTENETFNEDGSGDVLPGFETTLLHNDKTDAFEYTGTVTSVNGTSDGIGTVVSGSNGGQLVISEDGTFDFSANGDFDDLNNGDALITTFTYGIEGGDTATLTVTVLGDDDVIIDPEGPFDPEDPLDPSDPFEPFDPIMG